jgi:DNA polymerase III subunit chi
MSQISFYTLSSDDPDSRFLFACRLTEKARSMGHRIFILADSAEQARRLDELLWQFKATSFIPHSVMDSEHPGAEAVAIGTTRQLEFHDDVLINLSQQACHGHARFKRINEIIAADPHSLACARESYRFYQAAGYNPETHKL